MTHESYQDEQEVKLIETIYHSLSTIIDNKNSPLSDKCKRYVRNALLLVQQYRMGEPSVHVELILDVSKLITYIKYNKSNINFAVISKFVLEDIIKYLEHVEQLPQQPQCKSCAETIHYGYSKDIVEKLEKTGLCFDCLRKKDVLESLIEGNSILINHKHVMSIGDENDKDKGFGGALNRFIDIQGREYVYTNLWSTCDLDINEIDTDIQKIIKKLYTVRFIVEHNLPILPENLRSEITSLEYYVVNGEIYLITNSMKDRINETVNLLTIMDNEQLQSEYEIMKQYKTHGIEEEVVYNVYLRQMYDKGLISNLDSKKFYSARNLRVLQETVDTLKVMNEEQITHNLSREYRYNKTLHTLSEFTNPAITLITYQNKIHQGNISEINMKTDKPYIVLNNVNRIKVYIEDIIEVKQIK